MKRILEESPVTGYQLFRFEGKRSDGTPIVYPKYYIRHGAKTTCTKTDRLSDAKAKVKKMAGEDASGLKRRVAVNVRVGTLLDLVIEDYKAAGRNSDPTKGRIDCGLRPYFADLVAESVDSSRIERWITWRRELLPGIQPASINRELALLRRAFKLGYQRSPQLVYRLPPIKMLGVQNTRKGFVTAEQYRSLIKELPEHLRPITCIAFHVANRRGELLNMEWPDIDLDGDPPVFTLWPGETKNKNGRTLPILSGDMMDTLRGLKAEHDASKRKHKSVFVNQDGEPLLPSAIRKAWASACTRAGLPGLLFHDLRRSAVRNLRRAGVTQSVAMQFSGHRTDAVFRRYDITDFNDLRDAAAKLGKYLNGGEKGEQGEQPK
jgi:integrase